MERTLIGELHGSVGKEATIAGWVNVARHQSKMSFFNLRDRSGEIQCIAATNEVIKEIRPEWVVEVAGKVKKRPEQNVNSEQENGDIELEVLSISILARAEELPFEKDADVNLDTLLDNRPLTVRSERARDIFSVQATIVDAYRASLMRQGFTEFQSPALVGADAEGGAAVFKVEYFKDHTAYLATSPQLYKQMMVGAFERVFTVAKIFRAESSATTRHLSELTQMDFEMGFIKDHYDVMAALETTVKDTVVAVIEKHASAFERLGVPLPKFENPFPVLTLQEAQKMIGVRPKPDMAPEDERAICEWSLREKDSDFIFITGFPTTARAFYTYEDPKEAPASRGFDLLFRGLEINSGAQRVHGYHEMVARIEARGMDPKKFSFYLQAFKCGLPPHGGCSTGLERFTMKILNLANVKEAAAFPRDMHRIDTLLSKS